MRQPTPLLVALLAAASVAAQSTNDILVRGYEKKLRAELLATGQRHVDLGWSIKDKGLIPQATYQLVLAVELSDGQHQGAAMVLNIVRTYEDAFWKKRRKKPRRGSLKAYEKKSERLVEQDRLGQLVLARAAKKAKLDDKMREHLVTAMRYGAEIEVGARGAKLDGFKLDDELHQWLLAQTVVVNGDQRRFEPLGAGAPRLDGLHEVADEHLIVRSDLSEAATQELHALGSALREPLLDRLDGAPARPLRLVVFAERGDYDAYLKACGRADVASRGFCDYGTFQTLVCAEGLEPASVNALVLHELSHLFFFGSSPVAMPDWYAEGFAETFGGQGTFAWDGKRLEVGGLLRSDRLDGIRARPMTLQQVLAGNAIGLMRQDHDEAMRFYAMSWALQRFLTTAKSPFADRFEAWEARCRGTLAGSSSTRRMGTAEQANKSFLAEFGDDLDAIEAAFQRWLQSL